MTALSPSTDRLREERAEMLYRQLTAAARRLGYEVEEDFLELGSQGLCDTDEGRIAIEVRHSVASQAAALAHQLIHAIRCEVER